MQQKTETHTLSASVIYGLTNHINLNAALPLIINRSVNRSIDRWESAFGDLSLATGVSFAPRLGYLPINVQLSVGLTIPLGGGIANVITDERNFASGTVDPTFSAIGALGITPGFNINTHFFTRQVVTTTANNVQSGDIYLYSMSFVYSPIGGSFSADAGVEAINRGQDLISGFAFPNSGGDLVFLLSGFSYEVWASGETVVHPWVELRLPVYTYVSGFQLTEQWNIKAGVNIGFTIHGHDKDHPQDYFRPELD